ncbi:MAG: CDP-diacylglycerol--glycerol-3-phosphate 3-phosphatidyltransferase [Deltaproteobacteria bacterium]|nr:CDP-diacylglycerol--glycerol-3-phosphate 3-phosphatidyltransferase [Deltaproteobacteria bacterium]MCL5793099.1 CDP-diacylglycerol--glycerol-3-phosphate 3-phosphatidyltransferase [Deltaproteobacteria bacterium]
MHNKLVRDMLKLPNLLSLSRILMVPVLIVLMEIIKYMPADNMYRLKWISFASAVVFGFGGLTDFFDGYFARKYKDITTIGKLIDPVADKVLVATSLIMLISINRIYGWVVVLIIGREFAVTGLRSIASSEGIVIPASLEGKYKTVFQITGIIGLLIHYTYFGIDFQKIGMLYVWIALIVTLWSGTKYFINFSNIFGKEENYGSSKSNTGGSIIH